MSFGRLIGAAIVLTSGCYSPAAQDCSFTCNAGACPSGLHCVNKFCRDDPNATDTCGGGGDDAGDARSDGSSGYSAQVLASGPLGYWRLGESMGTVAHDEDSDLHAGTVTGAVTFGAPGALLDSSTAAAFHNASMDCITVGDSPDMRFVGSGSTFTLEAWVRLSTAMPATLGYIISKSGYTTGEVGYALHIATTGFAVFRTCNAAACDVMASLNPLVPNQFYYLVATFNGPGNEARLFVNGVRVATKPITTTPSSTTAFVAIGCRDRNPTLDQFFDGVIDEVAVYNTVLADSEILAHYQAR